MSILENALLKVKNFSKTDYQVCYELMHNLFLEYVEFEGNTLEELLSELDDNSHIKIKEISGIAVTYNGEDKKLFNYPEYHWDGGNLVYATVFNLVTLDENDFGGGPKSYLGVLENENYPAFVLYNHEGVAEIQIFQ